MNDPTRDPFKALARKISSQAQVLRTWPLKGGVSAQVTALEVRHPDGQTQTWIVRQHGERDLQRNPNLATDEFKLLHLLHSAGVAAPAPIYLDQSTEIFPTPVLVIQYIEGETEFSPANLDEFLRQFAAHLVRIHRVDQTRFDLSFLPQLGKGYGARPATLDTSLNEGQIRDTLETLSPPSSNPSTLLHGDYWPGNVLWKDDQLVAVIDWEDAGVGDPLADVGNARLELLWAFGRGAMERFTELYQLLNPMPFDDLPYWDLCAALRPASKLSTWGLEPATEKTMRERYKEFVRQAFEKL